MSPDTRPATPGLRFRQVHFERPRLENLTLPRLFVDQDGDGTNALVFFTLGLEAKGADPFVGVGATLVIPPRLFWLLDAPSSIRKRLRRG